MVYTESLFLALSAGALYGLLAAIEGSLRLF
jgi:hypothetical protein